jgi:hypothetical protein
VVITVGPAFSVSAQGPLETLEKTEVTVEDGKLEIHPVDDDRWRHEEWRNYRPATFTVTLPRLSGASMVGSGAMEVDRVEGGAFEASLAGSGTFDIETLSVGEADLAVAGSGELAVRGTARRTEVSIAGAGSVRAHDLSSEHASISIAGSGGADLTVRDEAKVSIVGSGEVDIAGAARCTVSRIGSGDVSCANIERETEISFR